MDFKDNVKISFKRFKQDMGNVNYRLKSFGEKIDSLHKIILNKEITLSQRIDSLQEITEREIKSISKKAESAEGFMERLAQDLPAFALKEDIDVIKEEIKSLKAESASKKDIENIKSKLNQIEKNNLSNLEIAKENREYIQKVKRNKAPELKENFTGLKDFQKFFRETENKFKLLEKKVLEMDDFIDQTYRMKKDFVTKEGLDLMLKEISLVLDAMSRQAKAIDKLLSQESKSSDKLIAKIKRKIAALKKKNQ